MREGRGAAALKKGELPSLNKRGKREGSGLGIKRRRGGHSQEQTKDAISRPEKMREFREGPRTLLTEYCLVLVGFATDATNFSCTNERCT